MDSQEFRDLVRRISSSISFAWVQLKPEMLQTVHQLALDSLPGTRGIRAPLDNPVYDLVMGTQIRPSEMQAHLLNTVVPVTLVAIQSIGEDILEGSCGNQLRAFWRIESLVSEGRINRDVANAAHYWRIVRNVLAHAQGVIDIATEQEVARLRSEGRILFDRFKFWGPLLDAWQGGVPVPIVDRAALASEQPDPDLPYIEIVAGNRVKIGIGDLLAAGNVWAKLIEAAALSPATAQSSP